MEMCLNPYLFEENAQVANKHKVLNTGKMNSHFSAWRCLESKQQARAAAANDMDKLKL